MESIFRAAKRFIYMRVLLEYLKEFSLEPQLWNCGKGSRYGAVATPLFETIFDWNDCRIYNNNNNNKIITLFKCQRI